MLEWVYENRGGNAYSLSYNRGYKNEENVFVAFCLLKRGIEPEPNVPEARKMIVSPCGSEGDRSRKQRKQGEDGAWVK